LELEVSLNFGLPAKALATVGISNFGFFAPPPRVGNDTYGERPNPRLKELANYAAPRVMLHARDLAFEHPDT
jgi:hypothetical protein